MGLQDRGEASDGEGRSAFWWIGVIVVGVFLGNALTFLVQSLLGLSILGALMSSLDSFFTTADFPKNPVHVFEPKPLVVSVKPSSVSKQERIAEITSEGPKWPVESPQARARIECNAAIAASMTNFDAETLKRKKAACETFSALSGKD